VQIKKLMADRMRCEIFDDKYIHRQRTEIARGKSLIFGGKYMKKCGGEGNIAAIVGR
jgi:hypothetical protein